MSRRVSHKARSLGSICSALCAIFCLIVVSKHTVNIRSSLAPRLWARAAIKVTITEAQVAAEPAQQWTSSIRLWRLLPDATFVGPQSQCALTHSGKVQIRASAAALQHIRGAAGGNSSDGGSGGGAASPLPFLFDASLMPGMAESCDHCTEPHTNLACCGVCIYEGRRCDALYPGQGKVPQILEELRQFPAAKAFCFEDFTPCELFHRIRGRTLWFMGDSQTWHFYYAAECFLREFAPSLTRSYWTERPPEGVRNNVCLRLVGGTRVCALRVDSAEAMTKVVLPALRQLRRGLHDDIMVYNVGLHHSPFEGKYQAQLETLAGFLEANQRWLPTMVWVDTAPQHFATPDGSYLGAQPPYECRALGAWAAGDPLVLTGGRYNTQAAPYLYRLGQGHLRTWNATVPLWHVHKPGECTHWCQPTAYHVWLYLLNGELERAGIGNMVAFRSGN